MWKPIAIALTALLMLMLLQGRVAAQSSDFPVLAATVTYDDLSKLGSDARGVYDLRDNYLVYQEALEEIAGRAIGMQGAEIEFEVVTFIVTMHEVYLKVPKAEITLVQIIPRDVYASRHEPTILDEPVTLSRYLDYFGPSKTHRFIKYFGPPSTVRYNLVARPASIVIGAQVSLEFARGLRGGDRFHVRGRILGVDTKLPASFVSETVVFITDVIAIEDESLHRRSTHRSF